MQRGLLIRLLSVITVVAGCTPRAPTPAPHPHYVVGDAYRSGGVWQYPREQFQLDTTGLADIIDRRGPAEDGEAWEGMVAAHGTLQLPAIIRVTNLETGLQVRLRVIGRGPPGVHRLLGVSRRAGALLGMAGPTQIRLEVLDEPSQALRERLLGGPAPAFRAPRDMVLAEPLGGPGGRLPPIQPIRPSIQHAADSEDTTLPLEAERVRAAPGTLWLDAGRFTGQAAAQTLARRLGEMNGRVERTGGGKDGFRVRAGPFPTIGQADSALDQALQAGVTDARIVVE